MSMQELALVCVLRNHVALFRNLGKKKVKSKRSSMRFCSYYITIQRKNELTTIYFVTFNRK